MTRFMKFSLAGPMVFAVALPKDSGNDQKIELTDLDSNTTAVDDWVSAG
jgi:hypothetical protein